MNKYRREALSLFLNSVAYGILEDLPLKSQGN